MYNFNRQEKNRIRTNEVVEVLKGEKPLKTILCLPSKNCLDLKEMLAKGIIDSNTFVIAVERVKSISVTIQQFLNENFKDSYLYTGNFYDLPIGDILQGKKIDATFADFCGNFTFEIQSWLFSNNKHFAENSHVMFTFKTVNRKKAKEYVSKRNYINKVNKEVERKLSDNVDSNFLRGICGKPSDQGRLNVLFSIKCYFAELYIAFDTRDFSIKTGKLYNDKGKSEMIFIDIVLNGQKKSRRGLYNKAKKTYLNNFGMASRNKIHKIVGEKAEYKKKRGRKKGSKNIGHLIVQKKIVDICNIKNRKDTYTAGRKMVISKYILKIAKEKGLTLAQASKRVWGGINRSLTLQEAV
jgi:hypothetical protein